MILRTLAGVLLLAALAFAQIDEATLLGGLCLREDHTDMTALRAWHALVSRQLEESRRGNREAALALVRQIVRASCSNEYWWLKLAESLADLDRPRESVSALEALYARRSNAVDARLRAPDSPLHRLLGTDVFQRSTLASKLAADRQSLAKRRREAQARLAAEPHPPVAYVAKPACPFECCGFGEWSVNRDTTLYANPAGTRAIGRVLKGETVEALTGEVHLRPAAVRVRFSSPAGFTAAEGSIVYLLDNLGEGYSHVWINGKIVESDVTGIQEHCAFSGPGCWGEFIAPEDAGWQGDTPWWVQVKTRRGTVGWTRQAGHFGGIDRCA